MATITLDGNSLASIIGAFGGASAAIITALNRRTARTTEKKTDEQTTKLETVQQTVETQTSQIEDNSGKLDEVHSLVNNQLTEAVGRRDVAEGENVELRQAAHDQAQARQDETPAR